MSTSSEAAKDEIVKALRDDDESLISLLSKRNVTELSRKMFQRSIISDSMMNQFSSLDHNRVEPHLQVRYLLRLLSLKVEEDENAWEVFLSLLSSMGEDQLCEYLRANRRNDVRATETNPESSDFLLKKDNLSFLLEVLISVSHKWELVGVALGLPIYEIENCRIGVTDNKISFSRVLSCWLKGSTMMPSVATLDNLKKVLRSESVGEGRIANDLDDKFRNIKKSMNNSATTQLVTGKSNLIVTNSNHTEVADGKSTLLLVQASPRESLSYQWKKGDLLLANDHTYSGVHDDMLVVSHACQGTEGKYTCCVSNQETQVCSNKITLTVLYPPAKKQLLNLYSVLREVPLDSWPPVGTKTFINLVLTRSSTDPSDNTDYSVHGSADKVVKTKEKVEYKQIFSDYRSGELLVIEGRPGSGKTTLVQKLVKDWSKGKILHKAKLVFRITLRNVSHDSRDESLSGILRLLYNNEEELKKVCTDVERDCGGGVCFIFDGLDEYSPPGKAKSVIYKLLHKTYLPLAMIIVSSRPIVEIQKLETLTSRIETFGFTKENILEYVDSFPFNASSSGTNAVIIDPNKLKEYLHSHPNIFDMCYLPVHAAMICFLYKYLKGGIPCTQTKLYEEFTRSMILRHLKHGSKEVKIGSLKELGGSIKEHFINLCHLAYNMTMNNKQVVTLDEVGLHLPVNTSHDYEWSLGLVTINHVAQLSGTDKTYTFLHLTFQAFLAAFFITTLDNKGQSEFINNFSTKAFNSLEAMKHQHATMNNKWLPKRIRETLVVADYSTVPSFYCGLMDYKHCAELLHHLMSQIKDRWVVRSIHYTMLQCVFESQNPTLCCNLVSNLRGHVGCFEMTPSDRTALVYIISNAYHYIRELEVWFCDDIVQLLRQICPYDFDKLMALTIVNVTTDAGMRLLARLLKSCTNLEHIILGFREVSPEGFHYVADSIKQLTTLKELHIVHIQRCSGISILLSGLQFTNTELTLSCSLDTAGVIELCSGFKSLTALSLNLRLKCSEKLGPDGAAALANEIPILTQLKDIDLSNENIGPDAVIPLTGRLQGFAHLTKLNLSRSNIGPVGMVSLADSMHKLTSLSDLNLSHNIIGPDGCEALANGIESCSELQRLILHSNHIGLAGAAALANVFHCITNVWELDLSDNKIGSEGAKILVKKLPHLTKLNILDLSKNNLDRQSVLSVVTATSCFDSLFVLNFNDNTKDTSGIDVTGLLSADDVIAISELKAAAQHDWQVKELLIESQKLVVPCGKEKRLCNVF